MFWRQNLDLLKLCNTPVSIYSPFPLFAISLFLISRNGSSFYDFPILAVGIFVSLVLIFPSNLWNHCNDLREDIASGKETILTRDISMQKKAIIISVMLFAFSMLFVYYLSNEFKRPIYLYVLIGFIVTWWYSDNLILKKVLGFRLKDHYLGELIAYSIAIPCYTLSIWLLYSDLNLKGIILTIAILFFNISGLLLKDLKDISGDKKADLKTFGVVFLPSQLIRYSCYLMVLFYLVLLNPFTLKTFGPGMLIIIIPFIYFLQNTFIHMHKKDWTLDIGDFQAIKCMGNSIYGSFIFIGLSAFF
ncbi:MAG: hypothetical protein FIB07_13015 [Candidatus Methanoperedens sp.]|nr:hypothetical protein [Candidatus Methanoperedens sp.]